MDLKTVFKKLNYRWKRFRRQLNKKPNAEELADKLPKLKAIYQLQKAGLVDVFFADETGFSLRPNIPYGWQKNGQQVAWTTQRQHVQNTFGLLNVMNKALHTFSTEKNIDSDFICQSIDHFVETIQKQFFFIRKKW